MRVRPAQNWKTDALGVAITVADTGSGMSPETQKKAFIAFYTTKGDYGTGLGLWVSKSIVERNHGNIRLRSREGAGSVFSLFLPYQAAVSGGNAKKND